MVQTPSSVYDVHYTLSQTNTATFRCSILLTSCIDPVTFMMLYLSSVKRCPSMMSRLLFNYIPNREFGKETVGQYLTLVIAFINTEKK